MSYQPYKTDDWNSMSLHFSTIIDCMIACHHMLENKDRLIPFVKWYDKARKIDSRTTYLFLKEHYDEFSPECRSVCHSFIEKLDARHTKKEVDKNE